ncbi:RNA polymerase-binding transcription factor DksA [Austwickia sp. TVS 96-490-7B]|uniref:TraR/DksA family transcriptional regulator n=1 Tax=Austwickia sp. TVS 96-490-7B TaxID=2830843 RepID=UPI001C567365|nr:TraR/DksA C4-type zinc finger protein [Austwickia sp. TVS 96-490-7B]MBW3084394.1 RNA polymerase-binding transcription factor DksA [Austwickia sp. TVS 96-490-7B]
MPGAIEPAMSAQYDESDVTWLPVRDGEEPWSTEDLQEIRDELLSEKERLTNDLAESEMDLADLMRDYGGGAGDDSADTGGKVLEREQELTLTNNSRTLLAQTERALERLQHRRYGVCESCGQPIGKLRLQAFPRATLCVTCKQKQERR